MSAERAHARSTSVASGDQALGRIDAAALLSDVHLLLVGTFPVPARRRVRAWLSHGDTKTRLDGSCAPLGEDGARALLVLRAKTPVAAKGVLLVQIGDLEIAFEPTDIGAALVSLATLVTKHLADAEGTERGRVLEFVGRTVSNERIEQPQLAQSLRTLRDVLRDALPSAVLDKDSLCPAHGDVIWRLDDRSFYIEGWVGERSAQIRSAIAVTPEGMRVDLTRSLYRYPRDDVAEFLGLPPNNRLGFISYAETPRPSREREGWLLEFCLEDGHAIQVELPPVETDLDAARLTILGDLKLERRGEDVLRRTHIKPALERVQARLRHGIAIDTIDQHGDPVRDAEVSVIVPLYRRMDFLEQQLAQFVHDPEFARVDLIYVLDSPEDAAYLRSFATELYRLYRVPFRVAVLTQNGGFSVVNNLGGTIATGRKLLLLNSDVLPAEPGWLSKLVRVYDETPNIGVLAPKLLYEDGSIQHAGLYFDRPAGAEVWSNEHYFKGLYRDLPASNVARRMPAVTGACLMIDAELYRELGGLRGMFIQGDYEDTDLCLRLRQLGRECWYTPSIELYHLEGQSYLSLERELASEYNKWLHTHIWDEAITGAMRVGGQ